MYFDMNWYIFFKNFFRSYIRVYFQFVTFIREHMCHKTILREE